MKITHNILADRTVRNMIGYWRDNVVSLSVRLSACLCLMLGIVVKTKHLTAKVSEEVIGIAVLGTWFHNV